ncbi:MAG: endonuclease [Myxococcota bacterium]|nr:endonuclease [Myxococcota bacterium]
MFLPSPSRLLWIALLTLGLVSGCGQRILDEDGGTDGGDAGLDGGTGDDGTRLDGGLDAGFDAGQEPITDGGQDAGQDAGQGGEGGPVQTEITAGPSGTVRSSSATFEFGANVPNSTFQCSLDLEPDGPCSSPVVYEALSDAEHTFQVFAQGPDGGVDSSPASRTWTVDSTLPPEVTIRVMAANITSGNFQQYQLPGAHIFEALQPDIVLIQEFTVDTALWSNERVFVDDLFGSTFHFYQETRAFDQSGNWIPNGVISRYPILASGEWEQNAPVGGGETRDYAWARIDIPGDRDLWVVSVHLYSGTSSGRATEAAEVASLISANFPPSDYLLIGGDLNTDSRGETAVTNLSGVVVTAAPYPVDQNNVSGTNASRAKPYDWLLADPDLDPLEKPIMIGASTFPDGLVFDSRVYTPLSDVTPVEFGDSAATNMQHMAVIRDFLIPQ